MRRRENEKDLNPIMSMCEIFTREYVLNAFPRLEFTNFRVWGVGADVGVGVGVCRWRNDCVCVAVQIERHVTQDLLKEMKYRDLEDPAGKLDM